MDANDDDDFGIGISDQPVQGEWKHVVRKNAPASLVADPKAWLQTRVPRAQIVNAIALPGESAAWRSRFNPGMRSWHQIDAGTRRQLRERFNELGVSQTPTHVYRTEQISALPVPWKLGIKRAKHKMSGVRVTFDLTAADCIAWADKFGRYTAHPFESDAALHVFFASTPVPATANASARRRRAPRINPASDPRIQAGLVSALAAEVGGGAIR